jgi:mannose-6-phosphate isomerase
MVIDNIYPLKFEPILKEKIWGGYALQKFYNKNAENNILIGESWEISGLQAAMSVVKNGKNAGKSLKDLIEVYKGGLIGNLIYEKFGADFPLLIKFICAKEALSIQVHPGNELAKKRHNTFGKTEMWYILDANPDSYIVSGFSEPIDQNILLDHLKHNNLEEILNKENVKRGEAYMVPAGLVHAVGAGIVIAEIQQASDITYRLYDWNREGPDGSKRDLNIDLALDAINYFGPVETRLEYESELNKPANLVKNEFFCVNKISIDKTYTIDYNHIDSFVIYLCTDGEFVIMWNGNSETVKTGETILVPAMMKEVILKPLNMASILEIFIV